MNELFIPYEQALELKELGFNEECFMYFSITTHNYQVDKHGIMSTINIGDSLDEEKIKYFESLFGDDFKYISRPTYQQVFNWFDKKYELYTSVNIDFRYNIKSEKKKVYIWNIQNIDNILCKGFEYVREDSELCCIKNLISTV